MRRLLFSAAAAVTLLTACNKDDNKNQTPASAFTIEGQDKQTTATPFGFRVQWSVEEGGRMLMSNVNINAAAFSGKIDGVSFQVDTFVNGQTYTFKDAGAAGFDKRVNFSAADVVLGAGFANNTITPGTGKQLTDLQDGRITIQKDPPGETYRISYILNYGDAKVSGEFNGLMPVVNK
ncbi:hypothetical protein [Chitinophaga ginsengisoli]|uniref:Uncharacterized protein n=1 Tax=Chitinophaga ginsengisoli TaxID=363837 RepID=A0A2P8GAA4_9BACT|nr:hypothetical protein [Chitinophaga ginsengisoli]PSL30907.1 hypothetical protein CLV42_105268 [Chitinophaga ginsengisoli]